MEMWMERAENGDAAAQYQLACCFEKGMGGPIDWARAFHWYWRAANQGHARAQYQLGIGHSFGGPGINWDHTEACKWLLLASRQGIKEAATALKSLKTSPEQRAKGEEMAKEFRPKEEQSPGTIVSAGAKAVEPRAPASAKQLDLF